MDRSGQQLRYSNGTLNSVALRSGGQIGCCEMYRNKNSCVCMMVKNKQSDFVTLPECSGMCTNQNINIYIENYETRTNKEKYGMKCESANLNTYPYYEMKSESKMSELNNLYIGRNQFKPKPIYTDVLWTASSNKADNSNTWDSAKNISNVTYYPYLNNGHQYIKGKASLITEEVEKKTSVNHVHLNISSGVEKSLIYNEINKKYISRGYADTNKGILNSVSEQNSSIIVSGTSPSLCNNLYVAPPYFTVDKFVNPEQANLQNTQHTQFSNRNVYNNNRMHSNNGFEYNVMENHSVQTRKHRIVNEQEKMIGSSFVDNSKIHVEASLDPIDFNIRKKHRHLPIKEENCDYEKDCICPKIENCQNKDNMHMNLPCIGNSIERNEFIKNKNNPPISFSIDHYDTLPINLVNPNLYSVNEFHARCNAPQSTQHDIAFHGIQYTQYKKNCSHQAYAKQSYTNLFRSPAKAPNREIRKPNYRKLINHVHALRNATSEDDLNMQIIKRTLNYKQLANDGTNSVVSKKHSSSFADQHELVRSSTKNILSPLDLSVKTITNPDSTESILNCKALVTEIGYLPKFNFKPNFSEKHNAISKIDTMSTESDLTISNTLNVNQSSMENGKIKTDANIPNHSTMHCNDNNNIDDYSLGKGLFVQTSIPKVRDSTICSLQNCVRTHIGKACVTQDSTDIKLEVTLKRTIPLDKDNEHILLPKKVCLESCLAASSTLNKFSTGHNVDLKQAKLTPKTDSVGIAVIASTEQLAANVCEQNANSIIVTNKDVGTKNTILNEPCISVIKSKQDVSSIIAARIRTKAELKGFIFQEEKSIYHKEAVSDKENCQCNYSAQLSSQIDEMDLSEWESTCNDFVDQLISNCRDMHSAIKESKLHLNKFTLPSFQKSMSTCTKNHKVNLFQEINITEQSHKNITEFEQVDFVKTLPLLSSNITCNTYETSDKNGKGDTLKQKTEIKSSDNNTDCIDSAEYTRFSKINKSSTCSEEKGSTYVNKIEPTQSFIETNKTCLDLEGLENTAKNENTDKQISTNIVSNNVKAIDLTKISVVRLKRENYTSNRYTPCEKNAKLKKNDETYVTQINNTKETSKANREIHNTGRSFPTITKSTLMRKNLSFECPQRRKHNVNAIQEKGESKSDTITTRLQHKRLQLKNNMASACKNKKVNNLKKENTRFRRKKPNDRDLLNDPNKLFLEVYRYKRALKVPPNLITIKNSCVQRISSSLPDLDVDIQNSVLTKESNINSESECKVEDVPKSIIDVLHSRVVKAKHQSKNSQKHYGVEHHTSKLVRQQYNNTENGFKVLNNNHSDREHRNVFETQILASRTRMEYKMQLNKEVIREIFGGTDRPASAPPEINNLSNDIDLKTKNNKSFQKHNSEAEQDIVNKKSCEQHKHTIPTNLIRLNSVINRSSKGPTNGNDQSVLQTKCKRKKSGRPYRRKFSSGFDYLRKRKKSNAHTLYNYSMLKTKAVNYMNETNLLFKNENDVSREIQKWVLNKGVGQSALHKAARLGYIDVIVYCLEKMKLNPDHKDNAGYTPLHDACINGSLDIARVLLQYGANHSEGAHSGIRPLHEASENGNIEIVRMLLSYGADPLLETYSGQTPLMLASDIEMNELISMHLLDVNEVSKNSWRFPGPWKLFDATENGYDAFNDASSLDYLYQIDKRKKFLISQNQSLKNDVCDFEIYVDAADAEGELFEFEEANMPLPPLYLLKDEGMEKWVLLSDLCSLLKVKSKETLLHKIFPSIPPATVSRAFIRELKMCEFLEKATCLQLLCAGEKINICHSKVVLIQYNENVRKLLGVKTILMKL